ncbi:uncharacterized protein LOC126790639 [Argentina anserina]|uniref:uncharacterized protein LOC126790639 n=1 Tax=Argentina anserina TaxID=57926 RepID=UPI002176259F|nr:uncharacterized protein LOC126790639 [Potentilla anserina]
MNSNFDFDLGLGSNRPRSLNDQKNKTSSSSTPSKPAWQPNKTSSSSSSWTHQPAPAQTTPLNGPTSMVGDIFGKSWASSAPSASATPIAVVNKNPNLFGDLVSSAMGGKVSNTNVPLKNANKASFSMGNVADSLPKTTAGASSGQSGINWGSNKVNNNNKNGSSNINSGFNASSAKSSGGIGGPPLRNMGSSGGGGIGSMKDPFGSLVDLASKPAGGMNTAAASKGSNKSKTSVVDDAFGDFQNAPKPSSTSAFGDFQNATKPSSTSAFPASGNSFMGPDSFSGFGDFGASAKQNPVQSTSSDPLDMFFPTSSGSGVASSGVGAEQSSGIDDWGTEFGGGVDDVGGSTTELEGLPPPPAGVSASRAKSKGMDNYKQGQYPDAIKWLSWAVVLLEKAADRSALSDVLSSRASCYKEVGEYKKAVADCTKVLEKDDANVSVLVQRALLYESMEKYKLGAEDLRTVLRIDPGNRVARGTIHRLTQLAD